MLDNIKSFYNTYKYAALIAILSVLFSVINLRRSNNLEKKLEVATQNLGAAQDTLRITKDRNGKVEYDKLSFLTSRMDELQQLNADLYNEVKATQGQVSTIIKMSSKIVHDTVPLVVNSTLKDGVVTSNFKFDTTYSPGNYRKMVGFTQYDLKTDKSKGLLTHEELAFTASTGIREINGKQEIFFKPDYPGLVITDLKGAVIDPNLFKTKAGPLINFSVSVGYLPVIYDFRSKKTELFSSKIGISAGVSINVNRLIK